MESIYAEEPVTIQRLLLGSLIVRLGEQPFEHGL
jgi:hypothetical protein